MAFGPVYIHNLLYINGNNKQNYIELEMKRQHAWVQLKYFLIFLVILNQK